MSYREITYWARVGKPVTTTYRQRFWKTRRDGVRQRYWKTVTRTAKKRKKITRRIKVKAPRVPKVEPKRAVKRPYKEYTFSGDTPKVDDFEFRVTAKNQSDAEKKMFATLDKTPFHGFRWAENWKATGTRAVSEPIEGVKISMIKRKQVYFTNNGLVYSLVNGVKKLLK